MVLSLALSLVAGQGLYPYAPFASGIPKPEALLGYQLGTRQTTYREQEQVIRALVAASRGRAREIAYGKSVEGRPLRIIAISSPANLSRLEQIRKTALSVHAGLPAPANQPVLVWINQCIHGNEPASFEASMATLYNLIASDASNVEKILANTVILLNPSYNPDGHERFAVWSNSIATGDPTRESFEHFEPSVIHGRTNHYRFDMNRDRVAMSQPETQQEVAEFLRWQPQVYVDQHGQTPNYFFPPNPMSVNPNVDRNRLNKWTDVFGRSNGALFDRNGWQYFIKDVYDLYYAGYLDSFTSLSGAIGMTYETDGGYALKKLRGDNTVLTLRDGVIHHVATALNTIETASNHASDLLTSYTNFKAKVTKGETAGKFQRVVLFSQDSRPLVRLQKHLQSMGIESQFVGKEYVQPASHDFWNHEAAPKEVRIPAGSLVINMAQPQGALAKAMLEAESNFEPEFLKAQLEKRMAQLKDEKYPGAEGTEFYDLTGWSLVYAYNLQAVWCEQAPAFEAGSAPSSAPKLVDSQVGWALRYSDDDDILAVYDALKLGCKVLTNPKTIKMDGQSFDRGTFFFLRARNDDSLPEKLVQAMANRKVQFVPLSSTYPDQERYTSGSENMEPVREPSIAVVFGDRSNANFSAMWYLMERRWKLPFVPIASNAIGANLSKYSTIVFPEGFNYAPTDQFRDWLSKGGCAVVLGDGWANSSYAKLEAIKLPNGKAPGALPGALFKAELDPRSFLSAGYTLNGGDKISLAVPFEGDAFYKAKAEGGSSVQFSADEKVKKLLTGWIWPNDTELGLKGAAWMQDVPVGSGHLLLFPNDPSSRALYPGLFKMILNAMLLGPSMNN